MRYVIIVTVDSDTDEDAWVMAHDIEATIDHNYHPAVDVFLSEGFTGSGSGVAEA